MLKLFWSGLQQSLLQFLLKTVSKASFTHHALGIAADHADQRPPAWSNTNNACTILANLFHCSTATDPNMQTQPQASHTSHTQGHYYHAVERKQVMSLPL